MATQPAASGSPAAAGVEIIANGQTTGTQLPYPPDYSMGSGMTTLDDAEYVLLAGGTLPSGADPGVRDIDLGCAVNCQGASWGSLPVAITAASAYTFSASYAFVVGNEPGPRG